MIDLMSWHEVWTSPNFFKKIKKWLTRPYTDKNLYQPEIKDGSNSIDFFGKKWSKEGYSD